MRLYSYQVCGDFRQKYDMDVSVILRPYGPKIKLI